MFYNAVKITNRWLHLMYLASDAQHQCNNPHSTLNKIVKNKKKLIT